MGRGGTILATPDGGQTWQVLNASSGQELLSVRFIRDTAGRAVGARCAILRLGVEGFSEIARAEDAASLTSALDAAAAGSTLGLDGGITAARALAARADAIRTGRQELAAGALDREENAPDGAFLRVDAVETDVPRRNG